MLTLRNLRGSRALNIPIFLCLYVFKFLQGYLALFFLYKLCARPLAPPYVDIVFVKGAYVVKPLKILQKSLRLGNLQYREERPCGCRHPHAFEFAVFTHIHLELGALGVVETDHQTIVVKGIVFDVYIADDVGKIDFTVVLV